MPTDYPGAIDSFIAPTSTDHMDDPGVEGDVVAEQLTAAVIALETYVGEEASADPTSITYMLASLAVMGIVAQSTPRTSAETLDDGDDMTGTSVTFDAVAGRQYEYVVENVNMVTGASGQKWNCLVLQDGTEKGITGAVTAAASDQAFSGSGIVRITGTTTTTVKLQMNRATGSGTCEVFGSAAAPVRAYVKDIGPTL